MLVLTLKEGDYFMIGKDIRVQYTKDEASGGIRVAVEAPRSLEIARSKVYEQSLREDMDKNAKELEELTTHRKALFVESQKRKHRAEQHEKNRQAKQKMEA